MAIYADYTTVADVLVYLGTTASGQNTLIQTLISATSRDMEAHAGGRYFYPRVSTRYFDVPVTRQLEFGDDVLAVTSITNGNGDAIASTEYKLYPRNETPYFALRLNETTDVLWEGDDDGNFESALSGEVILGWHRLYAHAWPASGAVLAAAITDAAATTFTATTGILRAGDLIRLDSEYLYVSSVSTGASDTITVVRGVNGSTAATHVISSVAYRWWHPEIAQICLEGVVAKFRLKNNPIGETIQVGEHSFQTPRDVNKYLAMRLAGIGAVRIF